MINMKVSYIDIDEIRPYEGNAKIHTAEQIERIKSSIEEFGFNDPIAVDKNNVIIEGHGRFIAAKELGIKKIPVVILDHLDEKQRKQYTLVHNKLTMNTGFNFDTLMDELDSISTDMDKYGFDTDDDNIDYTIENKEYETSTFGDEEFKYECDQCGFRFNA